MHVRSRIAPRARATGLMRATVALAAIVSVTAVQASQPVAQPVQFASSPRGHVLVPVAINGSEPLVFALDTAAGKTVVTPSVAERLGLAQAPGEPERTLGVHGTSENALVILRSLTVGDASAVDVSAVVLDLDHITRGKWHVDGILGIDVLTQFDVRLDFTAGTVSLYSAASNQSDCTACPVGVDGVGFDTVEPGFVVLPASVGDKPVAAVLDTGSGHSGLNSKAAAALGVTLPAVPAGASAGHGFGLQTGPVRVGKTILTERATLHVMDHPAMAAIGLGDRPAMLMGTDQLTGRIVTISYGLRRLFIE